jgi:peroxiredoxin
VLTLVLGVILPWSIVALGCWLGYHLLRQYGRMLLRLESLEQQLAALAAQAAQAQSSLQESIPPALPVGSPAPEFDLPTLSGGRKKLADFRGRRVLLVFFNPQCGFCAQMAPDLAKLPAEHAGGHPLPIVITVGDLQTNRRLVKEHRIRCPVLLQEQNEVAGAYQANGTPMGYLVDEEGRIASEVAVGSQALLELARKDAAPSAHESAHPAKNGNGRKPVARALKGVRPLTDSKIKREGLSAGTSAPDFRLPRVDGGELTLSDYHGRPVLLVFSEPQCGPCTVLAPKLEEIHQRTPELQLLMVSRGSAEENRNKIAEVGLSFPVVLQKQWEVSRDYGMFATPVGYLIDEKGVIAADVAAGADAILALVARDSALTRTT